MIQLKVDVLVTAVVSNPRGERSKTIPIVINVPDDPLGLVDNLARGWKYHRPPDWPGSGKRLELLTEAVAGIKRVGILYSSTGVGAPVAAISKMQVPARALKITAQSITVRNPSQDLDGAFREAIKGRANAVIIINTTPVFPFRKKITDLAIKNRLPLLAEASNWVDDGGLMSYGANDAESYRRLATYVDKILKGAKPADLPVEQPTKFELVINLKTAKEIGLTIPPNVLARADRVIK